MTTDLQERIEDHNTGVLKWTMHRGPWRLVWSQECHTVSEARKLEISSNGKDVGRGFIA